MLILGLKGLTVLKICKHVTYTVRNHTMYVKSLFAVCSSLIDGFPAKLEDIAFWLICDFSRIEPESFYFS